jgi:hypothetical protein
MTNRTPLEIPAALAPLVEQPRWVVWKWVAGKGGKRTKPPFKGCSPDQYASSTDAATWCNFPVAMRAYCERKADGIGFALSSGEIGAFDIDDCRNAETGEVHPWALELVRRCASYAEVTPSGTGIRIIGAASGVPLHRKFAVPNANGMCIEIYRRADRYITISGAQIGETVELANIDAEIDTVAARLGKQQKQAQPENNRTRQHDLDSLIRDGCGDDFGGDRSRAVWYVINELLKGGRSADEIVGVLLDRANGISAHIYDQPKPEAYARRQVEKAKERQGGAADVDAEINRLAALSPVQYEHERKTAAERLNIRAAILDKLVAAERPDDDVRQGHAISFPEPESWPERVDGAALLNSIADAIRSYVVLADFVRDTALWALHTYLLDCFSVSPRLAVCSPDKQCGKTTLLDVLGGIVLKPLPTANVTASAVFRVVEAHRPTLLVDEADTFLRDNDELRGIINSGHRRGGSVLRTVGDEHEPRSFATYSACAIALIGKLPDTLHDRSVVVDLKRRLPSEAISQFRLDRAGHLAALASQAARWCADHADRIGEADPGLPDSVYNRVADNWRPLLAVADAAGGEWPERARQALAQSQAAVDDQSRLGLLLADIKAIFAEKGGDRLGSLELVSALGAIEGRPWAEYRHGKPITQNQLARTLKSLGIAPERIRDSDKQARGYLLARFSDAFERYLPSEGGPQPSQRHKCDEQGTSKPFQPSHPEAM